MILRGRGKLSDEQKRRIARLLMARPLPTSVAGVSVRRIPPETWEEALYSRSRPSFLRKALWW